MNKPARVRPAAITLTPAAEARIAELMSRAPAVSYTHLTLPTILRV